jgi:uncharacterized protein DUF6602
MDINKLFEGSLLRLRTEAEYFSRLTDHNGELGRLNETHLVNLLRAYLPPKIGIGTGFIECGGSNPRQSSQCDIVLYDALNSTPLYQSPSWSIYPIEMVYGVVEVKTTLDTVELTKAFVKCAEIRRMAAGETDNEPNKAYMLRVEPPRGGPPVSTYVSYMDRLAPRFFVFAYGGWQTTATLEEHFGRLSKEHTKAHIHGVCTLTKTDSLFIGQKAFSGGASESVATNGFRHFLLTLPALLDSMVPLHRHGMGFDLTNLRHYALG